ncbi:hypothetical protein PRIPAC_86991 [Pristionchus pacificus]|uniref:Uncharacterized protein n=1 Tax=Pristionchus pacificus TaxID=54126 RepID=A0A2A6BSR7_PRIPA|nr:hypothetical protein PRIPAC_86991 [Pristionchus pacificus]|eukprot:PDM68811.1 hypothetical protein PRIPAC_47113 [Pristionchus pacificus]
MVVGVDALDSDAVLVVGVEDFVMNLVLPDDVIFGVTEVIVGLLVELPLVVSSDNVSVEVVADLSLLVDRSSVRDVVLEELLLVGVDRISSKVVVVLEELLEDSVVSILAGPEGLDSTVAPVVVVGLAVIMVTVVHSVVDVSLQSRHTIVIGPETKLFWLGVDVVDSDGDIVDDSLGSLSDAVSVDVVDSEFEIQVELDSGSISSEEVVGSVAVMFTEAVEKPVALESVVPSGNVAVSVKGFAEVVDVDTVLVDEPVTVPDSIAEDSVVLSEVVPVKVDCVEDVVSPFGCCPPAPPLSVVLAISVMVTSAVVEEDQ